MQRDTEYKLVNTFGYLQIRIAESLLCHHSYSASSTKAYDAITQNRSKSKANYVNYIQSIERSHSKDTVVHIFK